MLADIASAASAPLTAQIVENRVIDGVVALGVDKKNANLILTS
jgi:hypothetical protein